MNNFMILLGVAAALVIVGVLMSLLKKTDTVSRQSSAEDVFSDSEVGKQVRACLVGMYGEADDDRTSQQVDALKEADSESVLAELTGAYKAAAMHYHLRWAVVNLATMLEDVGALSFLDTVIRTEVARQGSGDTHRFPTVTGELMIRIRAVEGVRALSASGHDAAQQLLLAYLESPHFSIRKSAALGLLGLDGAAAHRDRIKELLPNDEHFILDIREEKVEDAGVVRYAAPRAFDRSVSSAPALADGAGVTQKRSSKRKGPPTV